MGRRALDVRQPFFCLEVKRVYPVSLDDDWVLAPDSRIYSRDQQVDDSANGHAHPSSVAIGVRRALHRPPPWTAAAAAEGADLVEEPVVADV